MEIEVRNQSGAVKRIKAEGRVGHGGGVYVLATWASYGDCFVDPGSGDVLVEVMPIDGGFYEVDLDTGRLIGSAWRVPMSELDGLSDREIGSKVPVEHARSGDRELVQLIDVEPSRGLVRVMARAGKATGRCLTTGWRVSSTDLARLRGSNLQHVA